MGAGGAGGAPPHMHIHTCMHTPQPCSSQEWGSVAQSQLPYTHVRTYTQPCLHGSQEQGHLGQHGMHAHTDTHRPNPTPPPTHTLQACSSPTTVEAYSWTRKQLIGWAPWRKQKQKSWTGVNLSVYAHLLNPATRVDGFLQIQDFCFNFLQWPGR